ncbi:MAG: hypothetical protein M0Q38_06200 [Bacteroidales bacterium]|jgi:hypothetical protein|nr:hypothetical protein [Bacteroidales bacterium]
MNPKYTIFGLPLAQAIGLFSFLIAIISIWVHMEIRLAELNIEIVNLKQDMMIHKADNRKDMEILHTEINTDMKEIIRKIDEIQIYLRNGK